MVLQQTCTDVAFLNLAYVTRREALNRLSCLIEGSALDFEQNGVISVLEPRDSADCWVPGQLPIAWIVHFHPSILVGILQQLAGTPGFSDCVVLEVQPAQAVAATAAAIIISVHSNRVFPPILFAPQRNTPRTYTLLLYQSKRNSKDGNGSPISKRPRGCRPESS